MLEISGILLGLRKKLHQGSHAVFSAFHNWPASTCLIVAVSLNLSCWSIAYLINQNESTNLAILNYKVDFGITYADHPRYAYMIPLLGLVIILANSICFVLIRRYSRYLAYSMLTTALLCNFVHMLAIGFIYFMNFRQL